MRAVYCKKAAEVLLKAITSKHYELDDVFRDILLDNVPASGSTVR